MSRPRVLVVDDDAFIRRPLQLLLERSGFEADTAREADEALDKARAHPPDLICLDIMMPGRDGYSVCESIRSEEDLKDIPVILLTARGQDSDRERGFRAGATEFISKPYSPKALVQLIRTLLARGSLNDSVDPKVDSQGRSKDAG